ncbi:hypothetical protein D1B31_01270 [Neobacillus notoginsengisoli]|uniref:Uncharacterized protein n=1 Tax=Neobacillus notoginsengisoli TaxID=1578198 RepID=A0A417Z052_9BACI|nr:hypothetical protein [Neobacillus notoginsengisoli]RHW43328.1 hypothetical protein D1B31_01270 [Neobacillus notoginsengisoli]
MSIKWKRYLVHGGLATGLTLGLAACGGDNNPPPESDFPDQQEDFEDDQYDDDQNEMENDVDNE